MIKREELTPNEVERIGWRLEHSYASLPEALFARASPRPVGEPRICVLNRALAAELGLAVDALPPDDLARVLAGQALPSGAETIAQAYAGHQYGHFTMLGDGRAILLGEQRTPSGATYDIHLKGAGQTPFSRRGDGLAALGPMLREHIVGEALHAMGIPTSRSLAVITTGDHVHRDGVKRGAILVRIASSHIRVGTFQYASAIRDEAALQALAEHSIERHAPELRDLPDRHLLFLRGVIRRQAVLVAQWQLIGFVHGVMNTDNMAISGETLDLGPCAFMDAFDRGTVFSSIDHGGRYAYGEQPRVAQWNLARFAEAILPLLDQDRERAVELAIAELEAFPSEFEHHWLDGMRRKLGMRTAEAADGELVGELLDWMEEARADFTNTFRSLSLPMSPKEIAARGEVFGRWQAKWIERLGREGGDIEAAQSRMRHANPAVIPRNHRVEEALAAAEAGGDLGPFDALLELLRSPWDLSPDQSTYADPPPPTFIGYRTFCGT